MSGLTKRETEVLNLICIGSANKNIAYELTLSIKTIEKHRQSIMKKLDAHSVIELINAAVKRGLIDCPICKK